MNTSHCHRSLCSSFVITHSSPWQTPHVAGAGTGPRAVRLHTVVIGFLILFCLIASSTNAQVAQNQTDNFQDGTLDHWFSGTNNPNPPANISSGGPGGAADSYMLLTSTGTVGAGSKLVVQNTTQWIGNYTLAGITKVSMHVKNAGSNSLLLRVVLIGSGGGCSSINAVTVPVGSGWISIAFPVTATDLTGGTVSTTLTSVTEMRIIHSTSPSTSGTAIAAQLGIDDITAAATPLPVEMQSFTAMVRGESVILGWSTATETNSYGFEIDRSEIDAQSVAANQQVSIDQWDTVGFVKGAGTTATRHTYSFLDNPVESGTYRYRIKQIDTDGSLRFSASAEVAVTNPRQFVLIQNYPNPFNPSTLISYSITRSARVTLRVYNLLGQEVATLMDEEQSAGSYKIAFDGAKLSSGIYFYRLSTTNRISAVKKMLLLK